MKKIIEFAAVGVVAYIAGAMQEQGKQAVKDGKFPVNLTEVGAKIGDFIAGAIKQVQDLVTDPGPDPEAKPE
jgi:hypothetical protein